MLDKPKKVVKIKSNKREQSIEWLYTPLSCFKFINRLDLISFVGAAWTIFFFFYEGNSLCRYLVVWAMVMTPVYLINVNKVGWLLMFMLLIVLVDYIVNTINISSSNWIFDTTVNRMSSFPASIMIEIYSTLTEMIGLGSTFANELKVEKWAEQRHFSFENEPGQMLDFNGFRYSAFDLILVCLYFKAAMKIDKDLDREFQKMKKEDCEKVQKMRDQREETLRIEREKRAAQFLGEESIVSAMEL